MIEQKKVATQKIPVYKHPKGFRIDRIIPQPGSFGMIEPIKLFLASSISRRVEQLSAHGDITAVHLSMQCFLGRLFAKRTVYFVVVRLLYGATAACIGSKNTIRPDWVHRNALRSTGRCSAVGHVNYGTKNTLKKINISPASRYSVVIL